MSYIIRTATVADAASIARLSGQLGYPANEETVVENLHQLRENNTGEVWVCEQNSTVAGFLYGQQLIDLSSGIYYEVMALVVDENYRSRGIGAEMMKVVIAKCKSEKINQLVLRSRTTRKDAHRFYEKLGFVEIKEQKVFSYPF